MKKFSLVLALVMICTVVLASCKEESGGLDIGSGGTSTTLDTNSDVRTVTAPDGKKVEIPSKVEKIAVASDSVSAIIGELGKASMIAGGEDGNMSGVDADVIFADADVTLSGAGDTPVILIPEAETVNDIKTVIRLAAEVTGSDGGEDIIDAMTSALNVAQSDTNNYIKKITAFIDLGDFKTVGSGTYISELLSAAGNKSVYEGEGYGTMTAEEIAAAEPEMIYTVGDADDFYSNPVFAELDAVKNKRVIELEPSSILNATNKVTDAVEDMYTATSAYVAGN